MHSLRLRIAALLISLPVVLASCGGSKPEDVVADAIDDEGYGSTTCTMAGFMEYLGERATAYECTTTWPPATGFDYEGGTVTSCYVYVDETAVDVFGSDVQTADGFTVPCPLE